VALLAEETRARIQLGDRPAKTYLAAHPEHGLAIVDVFDECFFSEQIPRVVEIADRMILMKHWNVAQTLHVDRVASGVSVTSEYVEGETLADLVRGSNRALSFEAQLRILIDVLSGLSALHDQEITIGTLTASTIIVGTDGVAKISGAHRAPLGINGMSSLERRLAPPEIALGHEASITSDIFCVGILLWEAIARRPLLEPRGAAAPPAPSKWMEPLATLAARALSIDSDLRPASAAEMAAAIRLVARARMASAKHVADSVADFGTEHVLARRARLVRTSDGLPSGNIVTPFETSTSPRGRVPSFGELEPPTQPNDDRPAELETTGDHVLARHRAGARAVAQAGSSDCYRCCVRSARGSGFFVGATRAPAFACVIAFPSTAFDIPGCRSTSTSPGSIHRPSSPTVDTNTATPSKQTLTKAAHSPFTALRSNEHLTTT
jgi:hypothetical protein